MKKILFALLLVISVFSTDYKAQAKEAIGEVNYDIYEDSIVLNWEAGYEKYKIYKDNKLVWTGITPSFEDQEVEEDYNYTYTIVAFENEQPVDIAEVKVTTEKDDSNISLFRAFDSEASMSEEHPLAETKIDSVATTNQVQLELSGTIPNDKGALKVYRDNEYLGDLNGKEFVDKQVEPGKTYNYSVIGLKEVSNEKKKEIKKSIKESNIDITNEKLKEMFKQPFEVSRTVKVPEENIEQQIKVMASLSFDYQYTYVFRYKTFINECRIPAASLPIKAYEGYQFGGDCRKFGFNLNKYRTMVETPVTFTNGGSSIYTKKKYIGDTHLYDSSGNLVETRRASSSGISYSNISTTVKRVKYHINHDVAIPFGAAPAINYSYDATVLPNGSFTLTGSRDQAPSHELYIYAANTDIPVHTIFRSSNKGFEYLIPLAPNAVIKEIY